MLSHTIFSLLFWSSMRSGELLALEPDDFNFDMQTIKISKNYARLNGRDLLLPPKTPKSNRQIVLPFAHITVYSLCNPSAVHKHVAKGKRTRKIISGH